MEQSNEDYGQRLRDLREGLGLSLEEVGVDAKRALGRRRGVSSENLRRMETGDIPEDKADPIFVGWLCERYDEVPVREVSALISDKLGEQRDLLVRLNRWIEGHAGQTVAA